MDEPDGITEIVDQEPAFEIPLIIDPMMGLGHGRADQWRVHSKFRRASDATFDPRRTTGSNGSVGD